MKKLTILLFGFISMLCPHAMSQEAADASCLIAPPYTAVSIIIHYRYAFIPFIIILVLKFIKNRQIPESVNFIPFLMGLVHAILKWVWFYRTAGMGHPDRMANKSLEIIAFGAIFTVLLISVDVIRSLIKPKTKESEPAG